MTLEEIRTMCDDSHDDASFRARQMVSKRDLAALLVRAVEEMRVLVGRCVCEDKDACLVCTPARSLLRELGVEA